MSLNETLLQTEDNANFWSVQVRGVHLWSLIRFTVLNDIVSRELKIGLPSGQSSRRISLLDIKRNLRTSRLFMPSPQVPLHDALFIVTGLTRGALDERYSIDRLHQIYLDLFERPFILESSLTPQAPLPDHHHEQTIHAQTLISVYSRILQHPLTNTENNIVDEFVEHVCRIFGVNTLKPSLINEITNQLVRLPALRRFVTRHILCRIGNPPTAFIENATYMGRPGILTALLHDAGYTIFEAQHGLISDYHMAYTWPERVIKDPQHPARRYVPDVYLTFGEFWSQRARIPADTLSVGSARLAKNIDVLDRTMTSIEGQILVISGDNRALALTQALAKAFPERPITFKLHPIELYRLGEFQVALNFPNVRVVGHGDTYALIAQSEVIVGHSSTVLVESVAFPDKRIFYFEPAFIPAEVGDRFTSAEELINLIKDSTKGQPSVASSEFWELNLNEGIERFRMRYLSSETD